ncbi:hypothetical protein WN55_05281 [Dufourea novaeangliae]|uniref:Uncharacterized protein n=1 Tax=Dufourea novaeangliae TaxID=178035 RepID=A0A154NXS8_DUFNO|nr:hypothetical protein WN55_05281 [Dufourea novaeangliae]
MCRSITTGHVYVCSNKSMDWKIVNSVLILKFVLFEMQWLGGIKGECLGPNGGRFVVQEMGTVIVVKKLYSILTYGKNCSFDSRNEYFALL